MRKFRLDILFAVTFLLFAAFVLGFHTPDVMASQGDLHSWVQSLQRLPQRLESVAGTGGGSQAVAEPLPLIDTYSAVMLKLREDYYGKQVDERELTYDAIRGVLRALGDPFTRFLDPDEYKKMREENEGDFTGIGAQLGTNKDGETYVVEPISDPPTPASRAGVKAKDVIIAVDDKPIDHMDIEEVVKLIRGPQGTKVKLTLMRPGNPKPFDKVITREIVQFKMVKWNWADEKNKIGYIRLYQFNEKSDEQFDAAMTKLEEGHVKGLVLDLRGNPGGLLQVAIDIGSRFIESGPVVIIQERGGRKNPMYVEEDKHNHKRYPMAVLVDDRSASASEIVSGAIKDNPGVATLVGVTTFGKGRVQTITPLQDGSAVAITTAKYLTPNGTDIHKKGIDPDIVVQQPDVDEILKKEGKKSADEIDLSDPKYDLQLAKGVEVVKAKLGLAPKSVLEQTAKSPAKAK